MRTKSYILEDHHIATIKGIAKDHGITSESAALRFIIDEWAELRYNVREQQEDAAMARVALQAND